MDEEIRIKMRGRDLLSGLPSAVEVSSVELRQAMTAPIASIVELVKLTLEESPPELIADIIQGGITLVGGGALLHGMDKRLESELHIPVHVAEDPLTCVARGAGRVAESLHLYHRALAASQTRRPTG